MSSQKQKALFLESKQGKFAVNEHDVPKPDKGQLLVKVHTAALDPIDYKIQELGMFVEKYPAILGVDIAGVVESVGEGVQNFAKGDKVLSHGIFENDQSSYQQYTLTVSKFTAKIPPNLDFDRAATVPLAFDTASVGLYGDPLGAGLIPPWVEGGKGKYADKPILIMGGASSVGTYTIQLAKLSGFSPIITTASLAQKDQLKALGATDIIDRNLTGTEFSAAVHKVTQKPIEIAYDAISLPETQKAAWSVVAKGGTLVLTLQQVVKEEEGGDRSIIATYGSPHVQPNQTLCRGSWNILSKWLEDGLIKPNNVEVLPKGLDGIPGGLERMREGKVHGMKLVARPQETA